MGFRFRKSIKVAPGVRVNLGKKSASVSVGGKGARYTVSTSGRRTSSVGIPGTGLSYVETHTAGKKAGSLPGEKTPPKYSPRTYKVCGTILVVLAVLCLLIGLPTVAFGGWIFLIIGALCLGFGLLQLKVAKENR